MRKKKLHERERHRLPGTLRTIVLDVTPRCDMRCPHCYAETFSDVEPIAIEILQRALEQAHEMGVSHYVLMGGEPILDPKRVEAILAACHPDESYITVTTNGWSMTLDKIRWLKSLQVDKLSVSLDSGIEAEHDANRRPGSYRRVMQMVDEALGEDIIVALDVLVTHQSLHSEGFRKAYDYAKSKGIRLDLQIAEPVGKWDGRKDVLITPEDARYIKDLQMSSPLTRNGERTIKRDIYAGPQDHCPAGKDFLHITSHGHVFPCNFLQFSLGNIRDKSLQAMRKDLLTCHWFSASHPICLCGEDEKFIAAYIMPHVARPKPLAAHEIFDLPYGGQK
ncbi:MAG: radical SAM protein [Elusimicrobia bacterium]|nr:radical SAM protein [Elusimicrobiota bacterium]